MNPCYGKTDQYSCIMTIGTHPTIITSPMPIRIEVIAGEISNYSDSLGGGGGICYYT